MWPMLLGRCRAWLPCLVRQRRTRTRSSPRLRRSPVGDIVQTRHPLRARIPRSERRSTREIACLTPPSRARRARRWRIFPRTSSRCRAAMTRRPAEPQLPSHPVDSASRRCLDGRRAGRAGAGAPGAQWPITDTAHLPRLKSSWRSRRQFRRAGRRATRHPTRRRRGRRPRRRSAIRRRASPNCSVREPRRRALVRRRRSSTCSEAVTSEHDTARQA